MLNDYSSDYKTRLLRLKLLPIMNWFEFQDIMFLVKCFQTHLEEFTRLVSFKDSNTKANHSGNKLQIQFARNNNCLQHFYFVRIARLWNSLPTNLIDLSMSFGTIKDRVQKYLVLNFERNKHLLFSSGLPVS